MTAIRRHGLQLDDPLGPSPATQPQEPIAQASAPIPKPIQNSQKSSEGAAKPKPSARRTRRTEGPRSVARVSGPAEQGSGVWREWSGITSVGSFRLPHELLAELGDTAREIGLPIGLIVTAAIARLLDQPPEQIAALVDRADDARIHGRRSARRRLTKRSDG